MTPLRTLPVFLLLTACGGGGGAMSEPGIRETFSKAAVSGDGQSGVVATALPTPLAVQVTVDGVPVAGVLVTFAPVAGSGSVATPVDTTDVAGLASRAWTLGTVAGAQSVQVTAAGFGNVLTFTASATAGAAATLAADTGDAQFQEPGLPFARVLRVVARDQFGNRVAAVPVEWSVAAGSGSLDGGALTATALDGTASNTITAGATPGPLAIRALSAQLPADTIDFGLTVTPVASVVTVASNFFSPADDTIPAGGAVRWVWNSGMHNVGPLSGPADFPGSLVQNAPATFGPVLFTVAGTYLYECTVHAGMTGTITVQ